MKPVLFLARAAVATFARDPGRTYDLLKKGAALSSDDAAKLEQKVAAKPRDEEARIQLLAYYTQPHPGADLPAIRTARANHILWLIENDPKEGLGLFQVSTGVYRLHCQGDDLADPDAAKRAGELWLQQLAKTRGNESVRRETVDAIQFCSPEQAERLLLESKDRRALGNLYAYAVLGMTGWTYDSHDPAGSDPARRQSDFAQNARKELENARDPEFVIAATNAVMRQGAILWADGKLDWDYTELGSRLLARARSLSPDELSLFTIPTALPKRGERPPPIIRIGGNVQQAKLLRQTAPRYPMEARAARISGTVELAALIGLDGAILHLRPLSGPRELIQASLEAVRDWVYKPTLLNGKPCYVETRIDVNYTISRQ